MNIFTIGYTKKSAETFFNLMKNYNINILVDVRLYNSTQLAGFSKSKDLQYFLMQICKCDYLCPCTEFAQNASMNSMDPSVAAMRFYFGYYSNLWAPQFAPTKELFNDYKNGNIDWNNYTNKYNELIDFRNELNFFDKYHNKNVCLLCAESYSNNCHRRLLAEKIVNKYKNVPVIHL